MCAALVTLLVATPGCTWKSERGSDAALHVQLAGEPVSLDPALAEDGHSLRVLGNVMDGLLGYDVDGELEPRLAETYQVSANGLRYEFTLRPGARWSDGKPVEARHFVAGLRRALSPETGSKTADFLMPIRGAVSFHAGAARELPGVREEAGKLIVELERPARHFLHVFALTASLPVRDDILAAHGGRWPVGLKAGEAVFTGPYRIVTHEPDKRILLESNPAYWGASPKTRTIELDIVRDETTAVNLFDRGKLDILTRVPTLEHARLNRQNALRTDPLLATYYLSFNCGKEPFSDREWRRAVAGSIHKKELVEALQTGETPARSWVPPGLEGHVRPANPDRSAELFAGSVARVRARVLAARPQPRVEAIFDSSDRNALVLEKVQQDLLKGLGLRITLSNLDWKTHIKTLQADPAPIYRFGWLAPFRDPITHLEILTTGNPNNYSGCSLPEYDGLVRRIEALPSGPMREKLIREAQRILVDREAVVVPLFHYVQVHALQPKVKGFRVNPLGTIRFKELELN